MKSFTSASLSQALRTLYNSILSRLFLLGERDRGEEVVKETFSISHSQSWVFSYWYHCKRCFFVHSNWQQWIMDFHMDSGSREITDLRPPTWLQWLPTALWIIHKASSNSTASGCSMAPGGSIASGGNMVAALIDHQHQHGFWLQLGPWISTRPQPQQGQDSACGCCALSAPWHRLPSWLTRHDHHVCSIANMSRFPSQQGEQAAWAAAEVVPPLRKAV